MHKKELSMKDVKAKNPVIVSDENIEALKQAQQDLSTLLGQLADKNNLTAEELKLIIKAFDQAFIKKRAELILTNKLSYHCDYLRDSMKKAAKQMTSNEPKRDEEDYYDLLYVKHTKKSFA